MMSAPSNRPQSASTKAPDSRPQSASTKAPGSRPQSASTKLPVDENALLMLAIDIRKLTKEIKILQRRKILGIVIEEPEEEYDENAEKKVEPEEDKKKVDPIAVLEEERHAILQKYEQLNNGTPFQNPPENVVNDFCELYYMEFDEGVQRNANYISKYYDSNPTLNIVGYGSYEDRDSIVTMAVKKYEGVVTKHIIRSIEVDKSPRKGLLYSASVNLTIKIANDEPRKVLQIFEFVKSQQGGPTEIVIKREFIVIKDTRPLYHYAEIKQPLSSIEKQLAELQENEKKRKELLKKQQEAEEAAKQKLEGGESVDDEDEDDGTMDNESFKDGGPSVDQSV